MGFVRPWKRCGCLSFCLHLVNLKKNSVWLCAGERCVAVALDIFRAPPQHLVCLLHGFVQQKGNRCVVMSTVDYSCNIARKICAPAAWTDWAFKPASFLSILPDEQLFRQTNGVGSFLLSTTTDNHWHVHTHVSSTVLLPFSFQT